MKFRGFKSEEMEVRRVKDGEEEGVEGHDHLEIIKDGVIQWYLHISDNRLDVFSAGCLIPIKERPEILVRPFGHDMRILTKES